MLLTIFLVCAHIVGAILAGIVYCIIENIKTKEDLYATVDFGLGTSSAKHGVIVPIMLFWEIPALIFVSYIAAKIISTKLLIPIMLFFSNKFDKNKKTLSKDATLPKNAILTESKNYREPALLACPHCLKQIKMQ